ncbi:membrane protein [Bombiscardovia apis]|uniref:Membrane protein n=1 Tax=Bombiscardovia apis TaxID=2932182 RepID=A0ABM8BB29_9BIFI|nr:DUF2318 domain-containing protein [Bombiscardovia apis]BDR54011.1 membrane protein [Bombiscardovia apis]
MLNQVISVLPGVLAPALLVMIYGVLLSAGEGKKKPASARLRLLGLGLGLAGALVFAGLRAASVINRRTMVNYPTLVICVIVDVLALAMIVSSGKATRDWSRSGRALALANLVAGLSIGMTVFRALPEVILHLTNFVETGEPAFTSEMLMRALGFLLGIAAAIVVALIFRSLRTGCPRGLLTLTAVLLMALIFTQHATSLLAIMQTVGDLRLHGTPFRLFTILYNANNWLAMAQVAVFLIPAVASFIAGLRSPAARFAGDGQAPTPAQMRKSKAFRRKALLAAIASVLAVVSVVLTLTVGPAQASKTPVLSPPEAYSLSDGKAVIPFSKVDDGHLHRFEYKAKDGTVMRFIIIKKNGGSYGLGLDACENCGSAGYYEKDGVIICKRCDVAINIATIGFKGGCNPIPFDYTTSAGSIVIQTATLDALSSHFK